MTMVTENEMDSPTGEAPPPYDSVLSQTVVVVDTRSPLDAGRMGRSHSLEQQDMVPPSRRGTGTSLTGPHDTAPTQSSRVLERKNTNSLTREDVVIAIMGVTGAGKSSFISLLTDETVMVGHELHSCKAPRALGLYIFVVGPDQCWHKIGTSEIGIFPYARTGSQMVHLIDTPGFDDTNRPDVEILKDIAFCFTEIYRRGVKLAGIIYLHRISDVRMTGTAVKNIEILQKLCGDRCFPNVVLATNMWTRLGPDGHDVGVERESMLRAKFWKHMEQGGSIVERHTDDSQSAERIVSSLIQREHPAILDIQLEMVGKHLTLDETAVGRFLQRELLEAQEKFQKEIAECQQSLEEARKEKDDESVAMIAEQMRDFESQMARIESDRGSLSVNYEGLVHQKMKESGNQSAEHMGNGPSRNEEMQFIYQTLADLQDQLEKKEKENRLAISLLRRNQHARRTGEMERAVYERQQLWEEEKRVLESRIQAQQQSRLTKRRELEMRRSKPSVGIFDKFSAWFVDLGLQYTYPDDRHVMDYYNRQRSAQEGAEYRYAADDRH